LIGEYIPTAKNKMVADLFSQMGFASCHGKWELDLQEFRELKTLIHEA
jgi:predicted enzyme involved in methoxymalonyl-ACP biosynthesis